MEKPARQKAIFNWSGGKDSSLCLYKMLKEEKYEILCLLTLQDLKGQGASFSVFGGIFLENLWQYREKKLSAMNFKGLFPLWKIPTFELHNEFINLGFKAIITCINENYLEKSFTGRIFDRKFFACIIQEFFFSTFKRNIKVTFLQKPNEFHRFQIIGRFR